MPEWISKTRRPGLSLAEVLVVIGIIGLILGIALPAIQQARGAANRVGCANNLKQMALAMHAFHGAHSCFPSQSAQGHPTGILGVSWQVSLLPFVEQEFLWFRTVEANRLQPLIVPAADPEERPHHEIPRDPPHLGKSSVVRGFLCPADARLKVPLNTPKQNKIAFGSYLGIGSVFADDPSDPASTIQRGVFGNAQGCRLADVLDGASQTLSIGERPPPASLQAGQWYSVLLIDFPGGPNHVLDIPEFPITLQDPCGNIHKSQVLGPGDLENPCDRNHFWSLHGGGANFALVDGSVRFIRYGNKTLIPAMATIAGGESIDPLD